MNEKLAIFILEKFSEFEKSINTTKPDFETKNKFMNFLCYHKLDTEIHANHNFLLEQTLNDKKFISLLSVFVDSEIHYYKIQNLILDINEKILYIFETISQICKNEESLNILRRISYLKSNKPVDLITKWILHSHDVSPHLYTLKDFNDVNKSIFEQFNKLYKINTSGLMNSWRTLSDANKKKIYHIICDTVYHANFLLLGNFIEHKK